MEVKEPPRDLEVMTATPSLTPKTHMLEETDSNKLSSDFHMYVLAPVCTWMDAYTYCKKLRMYRVSFINVTPYKTIS